jgi:hypothetical protein
VKKESVTEIQGWGAVALAAGHGRDGIKIRGPTIEFLHTSGVCAKRATASVAIAIEAVVARNNFASGLGAYALAYAFNFNRLAAGSVKGTE